MEVSPSFHPEMSRVIGMDNVHPSEIGLMDPGREDAEAFRTGAPLKPIPRYLSEQIDFPTGLIEGRQPKTGELIQTYLNRGHEGYKLFHMEKFPSNEWLFVWEKV